MHRLFRRMREPAASRQLALPSFPCCGSPAPAREPPSPRVEASISRRRCAWTTSTPAARRPDETFALDRVVNDGAWAGSRTQLVDDTNLGKYLFEVRAKPSAAVLYSRGFASIYGEWETTPEAKTAQRTFHESLRLPWPRAPVTIALKKRERDNSFREVWSADVDPSSRFVNRARLAPQAGLGLDGDRERSDRAESRPARHRRGLHARAAAEVPCRREAADWQRSSRRSRSRAGRATSTSARWTCRPLRAASTGRTPASFDGRRSRPSTTSSTRSATC